MTQRLVHATLTAITFLVLFATPALAPPLDHDGGNLQPYAHLDTAQVAKPGPCSIVYIRLDGRDWYEFCIETPNAPLVPITEPDPAHCETITKEDGYEFCDG